MSDDQYGIPELVELAKEDPYYFGLLVEIYLPSLSIYVSMRASRIGIDSATADDIVQETFLQAFTHLEQLKDPNGFRKWLYGIARNTVQEVRRKTDRRRKREAIHGQLLEVEQNEQSMEQEMTPLRLDEAIETLPPKFREIIRLKHFRQPPITSKEVADHMGIPLSTFYQRLHDAYVHLQRILRSYGD